MSEGEQTDIAGDGANARESKRYRVGWPTRIMLLDRRILGARTKDVSIGGVGFNLDESLPIGTNVNVELSPLIKGKSYTIRAKAEVTYCMLLAGDAGFSHGVKFTFIPPDQSDQLKVILKTFD